MFSQNRSKYFHVKKIGGSSFMGRHKGHVSLKTGAGFWGSVKGLFSKMFKKAAPVVKNLAKSAIQSGKVQDFTKSMISKGADQVGHALTKVLGADVQRDALLSNVGKTLGEKVTSEGSKMALDLLGKGIGAHRQKKGGAVDKSIDDNIRQLLSTNLRQGSGLQRL